MSKVSKIRNDIDLSLKEQFEAVDAVLDVRDAALTGYLIKVLHDEGIPVTEKLMDALFKAAERFSATSAGKYFLNETIHSRGPRR